MSVSDEYVRELLDEIFAFEAAGDYHQLRVAITALHMIVVPAIYYRRHKEIRSLYDAIERTYSRVIVSQPALAEIREETPAEKFNKKPLEVELGVLVSMLDVALRQISPEKVAEVANRPHNRALLHEIRDSVNGLSLTPGLVSKSGLGREEFEKSLEDLVEVGLIECNRVGLTYAAYLTPLADGYVDKKAA